MQRIHLGQIIHHHHPPSQMFKDGETLKQEEKGPHKQECAVPQWQEGYEFQPRPPLAHAGRRSPSLCSQPSKDSTWCLSFNSGHLVTRGRLENVRKVLVKRRKNEQTGESVC